MSFDAKRLYELLPAIYRIRDTEQGEPLKALLAVIVDQVGILEEDLAQLYNDQFIETCASWVVPYIGDLIGVSGLPSTGAALLTPRAEVAHTIGYRRRKGTAPVLEQSAHDITGWSARAVEFFQLLATTQYMNHRRPENRSFINVRDANRLEYLGSPFEHLTGATDLTHTVDVRRIASGRGRYNIPNIGIFLYRLRAYSLTRSPAVPASTGDRHRFLFSPLGNDMPLFTLPQTEDEITHLAEPINVPAQISRRVLARYLDDYYGKDKSILIQKDGVEVPIGQIMSCDLSDKDNSEWAHKPPEKSFKITEQSLKNLKSEGVPDDVLKKLEDIKNQEFIEEEKFVNILKRTIGDDDTIKFKSPILKHAESTGKIAVDPVLGRVAFPDSLAPKNDIHVTYHYGFSANMGGGEYNRAASISLYTGEIVQVASIYHELNTPPKTNIQDALDALGQGGTVEITDSGRYEEALTIDASKGSIEVRAIDERRPTVVLTKKLQIIGGEDHEVTLNGLLISGAGLRVSGELGRLRLIHCTLVPGLTLSPDGTPSSTSTPNLIIESTNTRVEIDHSIIGGLRSNDSVRVQITNSIVDATDETGVAYADIDGDAAGGLLHIENSTIIGKVHTMVMEMASNTIFLASLSSKDDKAKWPAPVKVQRRQEGCVRFSYLPVGAHVPRRYRCQPESDADAGRVRPVFTSLRYGDAAYCQLSPHCPVEIRQGADDESEMGAFHDLYQPQRESHLRVRLEEYLRFGLEVGIFYAT